MYEGFKYNMVEYCMSKKMEKISVFVSFSVLPILRNINGTRLEAECGPWIDLWLPIISM